MAARLATVPSMLKTVDHDQLPRSGWRLHLIERVGVAVPKRPLGLRHPRRPPGWRG
jgi:hypothetical protein